MYLLVVVTKQVHVFKKATNCSQELQIEWCNSALMWAGSLEATKYLNNGIL